MPALWKSSHPALSPREAEFVTGSSRKAIQQAIDRKEVRTLPSREGGTRERLLAYPDLLYLRLRGKVGRLLSAQGKRKLRQKLGAAGTEMRNRGAITVDELEISVAPDVKQLKERLARVEGVRLHVVSDPAVRGGEPVVAGTRVPVHMLAELGAQGATREELLQDYPSLTPESLEAALLYARMYPRRGRPRRAPWANGVVVSRPS